MVLFKVFGYCPCVKCWGRARVVTSSGVMPKANHTLAAPMTYRFGTKINLEGYGIYVVEDRDRACSKNNTIVMFFNTHQEVIKWGVKFINGKVVD